MTAAKRKFSLHRAATAVAAVCLTVLFVFSGLSVVLHAAHDCTHDERCPVCACVRACRKILDETSAADSGAVAGALPAFLLLVVVCAYPWLPAAKSLFHLKIRLNN